MKAGGKAARALTRAEFEKLGPSPEEAWRLFWDCADEDGGHYVWRGLLDAEGRGVFLPNRGPAVPAAEAAWAYDGRRLGAGEVLAPTCRRKRCIRPEHLAVQA